MIKAFIPPRGFGASRIFSIASPLRALRASRPPSSFTRAASTAAADAGVLSWPDYLAIRRAKHRWELGATIPSTFLAFLAGSAYFGGLEIDPTKTVFGFDPMMMYIGATVAVTGSGYLIGPNIGAALWKLTHRRTLNLIEVKDRAFHRRLAKHRVDPRYQSPTNPIPDFYGEKIGSLHQYRQWLRDQSLYKKKAMWPEN